MKYGLVILVMMALRVVHGAEPLRRDEPLHTADAVVIAASAESITTDGTFFGRHPDVQVRALEAFTESVVFKYDTRTEIIRIHIKDLDHNSIPSFWAALEYMFTHPEGVGFRCLRQYGFLIVDSLASRPIIDERRKRQDINSVALFEILKLARIRSFKVISPSDEFLLQLVGFLTAFGDLEELSIGRIQSEAALLCLVNVFHRHRKLKSLYLTGQVSIQEEPIFIYPGPQFDEPEKEEYTNYYGTACPRGINSMFEPLVRLERLKLENLTLSRKDLGEVLSQLPSLRVFEFGTPGFHDADMEYIVTVGRQHPSIIKIKNHSKLTRETKIYYRVRPYVDKRKPSEKKLTMSPQRLANKEFVFTK